MQQGSIGELYIAVTTQYTVTNVGIWGMNRSLGYIWSAGKSFNAFITLSANRFDLTEMLL